MPIYEGQEESVVFRVDRCFSYEPEGETLSPSVVLMDNILIITVLTIFATAFVGTIIKYRLRDKCLRDFRGYFVNLEHLDGRRVWGKLQVYHNGLELVHPTPILDGKGGHLETSTLLYQSQFGTIRGLKRFHDELSPENQERRRKEIARTYCPNLARRVWRGARNLFNLLRDAFGQAVSVFVGAFKKAGTSTLLNTQDARITSTTQQVISEGASSYEPILEKYIGRHVVLEVVHEGKSKDNVGILKEYSDAFVTVLDVPVSEEHEFNLAADEQLRVNRDFDFVVTPVLGEPLDDGSCLATLQVTFTNNSRKPVDLVRVEGADYARALDLSVREGATAEFALRDIPVPANPDAGDDEDAGEAAPESAPILPPIHLWVRCRRFMDVIVPRAIGTVRHGAEPVAAKGIA